MHLPLIKDTEFIKTPRQRIQVVERPGRPTMVFTDVGGKYMDFEAEAKRAVAADRRAVLKEKRRLKSRRRL
jgi:predicted secreted acid phosphatase